MILLAKKPFQFINGDFHSYRIKWSPLGNKGETSHQIHIVMP